MPEQPGTIERLALELAGALRPIAGRLADEGVLDLFEELGVRFPEEFLAKPELTNARTTIITVTSGLDDRVARLSTAIDNGDVPAMAIAALELVDQCGRVVASFTELATALTTAGPTLPGITPEQIAQLINDLPGKLLNLLLTQLLERSKTTAAVLTVLGVLERTYDPGTPGDPTRPPHEKVDVHLSRLLPAVADPVGTLTERFGWGSPVLNVANLFSVLETVLAGVGLPVLVLPGEDGQPPVLQAFAFDLTRTADGAGLRLEVVLPGSASQTLEFEVSPPDWLANVTIEGSLPVGTAGEIRPPFDISLIPPGDPVTGSVTVELTGKPQQPVVLIGQAGGSRLEFSGLTLAAGLELSVDPVSGEANGTPSLRGRLTGGKLVIDSSQGDGFIAKVLSGLHLEAGFELGFTFDARDGLRFDGSGGLELQIPVHLDLGPVEVREIYLLAGLRDGKVPLELSAGFAAELGPVQASVERVGLLAELSFPDSGGNLGPADLRFGFKPPSGIGLHVDAGLIAGGGYLYADPDRGEYAGALSLEFAGFVELNAIGLISTRMPDGTDGFSLLIVITAEFGSGIQLGYGFTLLAVGGLVGLNRGMNLTALAEGVQTGAIESVMFPRDVIANAPRILSDLARFFPSEQGTFLIGPMAKIGWGTPTLISVSLGVVVEIPPGTVAILGVLKCILPDEAAPLLVLQINFIGAFEPDKSRLWFFAQLFDSRILTMTIEGGMGLLVAWGDQPDFVLTVGGFHPSFQPPPLPFPVPPRLSVDILNQPGQLIRVSGYFAVTSNTVQFGAKAELRLGFSAFGIEGHLAFDALFRFSPFAFIVTISAGMSLKAFGVGLFGIDLRFTLEGPAPWRAHGRGSISLLFFEISADFDITWGEERNTTLPPIEVLGLLAAEVNKVEGWQTRLPTGGTRALVTLRQLPESEDLVLHPLGALFITQRAIPLNVRIDRVGAQRPSDGTRFSVTPASDSGLVRVAITGDKFAMAQFQDMDDAGKLSRPAYENQDAGLELAAASGRFASVRAVRRSARFEQIVIDSKRGATQGVLSAKGVQATGEVTRSVKKLVSVSPAVFTHLLNGSSTSRSPLSQQHANRLQPFAPEQGVQVTNQRYVVAYKRNNVQAFPSTWRADRTSTFRSRSAAEDALAAWVTDDPSLAGTLHVLPQAELAGDPAVPNTFTAAGPLPTAVAGTQPVLLSNRKVLLAGGADADGEATNAAALFDPVANAWAATAPLGTARRGHTTTVLADGRVLVTGGLDANGTALGSAEIYDPIAATWTAVAKAMATARSGHSATVLSDGRVVVAGGTGTRNGRDGAALSTVEILHPDGTWSTGASMTDARTAHQAVLLDPENDTVLVIGGELTTGGRRVALAGCETYDPATDEWTPTAGDLVLPRAGHQATRLDDGSVVVTGGEPVAPRLDFPRHEDPPFRPDGLAAAERYDPVSRMWQPIAGLPGGRTGASAVHLRSDRVLVIGGTGGTARDTGYRSVVSHAPADGTWSTAGSLVTGRWDFAAVELADGRVLVAGGRTRAAVTAATELFNP